jgi:hypothetical protein
VGMMALEHEQPVRFELRGLWLFLGSLSAAVLSWIPVLIYRQRYPPNPVDPGDLDLGGAGLASITLFVSAVFLLCGFIAVVHASISYIWRKLRAQRPSDRGAAKPG